MITAPRLLGTKPQVNTQLMPNNFPYKLPRTDLELVVAKCRAGLCHMEYYW